MYQHVKREKIDPEQPYLPQHYGIIEQFVTIGGQKRRFLMYIPDGVRESCPGVLVLGGNGRTADDLARESGWCALADAQPEREKFVVVFLEPLDGIWHIDEPYGKPDGDAAYINAICLAAGQRYLCCIHESKFYLAGIREGGVMAQMAAMSNAAVYAGLASVGGSSVPPAYMEAAAQDYCTNMNGFVDEAHRKNIRKGEVPVPAWIIDDQTAETGADTGSAEYWRSACGAASDAREVRPGVQEYIRTEEAPYAPNQEKEAFRVWVSRQDGASENDARAIQDEIRRFLFSQRRWMSGPVGDLRVTRDPERDLGMEYHYEKIDGWMREWYVYVPESVKKHPETKVPLVLAMHGYTCSGEIYAGNSEWYKVAEENGFIVVHPTALYATINMENNAIDPNNTPLPAWNIFAEEDRPDELHFFDTLLDRMIAEYPVDPSRVFATGHSWGSLMTHLLALARPERFAAAAPCSGVFFGGAEKRVMPLDAVQNRPDVEVPVWMFCGEEEPWLIEAQPTAENATGFTISMWLRNNHMAGQVPADWSDCQPQAHGRWREREWLRDNVPMVRFTTVEYMPHATMTEMSYRIWDEFFSKFHRNGKEAVYAANGTP